LWQFSLPALILLRFVAQIFHKNYFNTTKNVKQICKEVVFDNNNDAIKYIIEKYCIQSKCKRLKLFNNCYKKGNTMIFTENNKKLSFIICGYQYPQYKALNNEYDSDANWLNCEFKFFENDNEKTCVDPCLLTCELSEFIIGLSAVIDGQKTSYDSDFMEPYLEINVERLDNKIRFKIQFEYDSREDGKTWEVNSLAEIEQAKKFLNELKEFQRFYPER
jgi:hypothetical protein